MYSSLFYNPLLSPLFEVGFSVYDLEIKRGIILPDDPHNPHHPCFEYCKDFEDFGNMGISTAALYTSRDDRFSVYTDQTKRQFGDNKYEWVQVGYNSKRFDDRLLEVEWGITPNPERQYDILEEIWIGLGYGDIPFSRETHRGYGLDAMCKANLGYGKTLKNGKFAPMMWQTGRYGEVFDYNLGDVARTRALLFLIQIQGYLLSPKDGSKIMIRRPVEV